MNIALPTLGDKLSNHFVRAELFHYFSPAADQLGQFVNPTLNSSCEGRQQLIEQFKALNIDTLMLRNIGQNMLARLLAEGFTIWQVKGNQPLKAITASLSEPHKIATQLTDVSQARPSVNAIKAKGQSHHCCRHNGQQTESHCDHRGQHCHHEGKGQHGSQCCHHQHRGNHAG